MMNIVSFEQRLICRNKLMQIENEDLKWLKKKNSIKEVMQDDNHTSNILK